MDFTFFLSIVILSSTIQQSSSINCETKLSTNCNYEIKCSTNPGAVSNPSCDGEPYVTFIIRDSYQTYLTTGFFAATNFDSRVREIKGIDNTWFTIDSSAFRYYAKCLRIDLSKNSITRINTEAFRNLNYMKFLNLSGNSIESFYSKSFLISESRNNDLQELDVSNNKLEYLDGELNEVPNLKKLYLQNNRLSSLADEAFMNLKDLSHLYLQYNLLTSVNLSLTHLKSLVFLDISNNHLIKISGYQINRLVSLEYLNMSHNELVSIESNCFTQASNLQTIDLSFNSIKIIIENTMFVNNIHLNYIDFYNNKIYEIQENAFQYCNLSYLNLENNIITGDLKEKTLSNLWNLTNLDLSRQNITGIKNNAFADMENLLYLNLSKNHISSIDNSSFVNASINILDLSYNKIPNLNFLEKHLNNLTELLLNNNNITLVPKYIFHSKTKVKKLDLSANNIVSIQEYSLPLKNLQYLYVSGNQINGAIEQNVFSPARFLRFLDLSNFNITKINKLAFSDLPLLAKLNLSNNNIESLEENSFVGINNLYSLDLSNNNVTEFTLNITVLSNLKALHLRNNHLSNTSELFSSPCKLTYLDLSENNIKDIDVGADVLPNITVLNLDNNEIQYFNNPKTNSLTTLIDLGLSSNKINDIKLSYFKELMSVDLSGNNLTSINRSLLEKNEYLQALDISRNKITDLPPGTFQFMRNLKLLNLSSNYLTKLRYGSLKGLHRTEILDLSRNNITKLDVDIFHECDELKTLIIDYNHIKSFNVERLILVAVKKLRTLSLGGNPILCKEIVSNVNSIDSTVYAIRQVEVTSIDKIYHEDNVHGIKCGDDEGVVQTTPKKVDQTEPDSYVSSSGSHTIVIIWCSGLTLILITVGVIVYLKLYKKRVLVINRNMQLGNSMDLSGSDFQRDLLN